MVLIALSSNVHAKNETHRLNFTAQELAFLNTHPVIRVANVMDWPPFDFYEFGRPKGLSIDYIQLLADKAGLKIEFVSGYTWPELLSLFRKKRIDIIPALYKNKKREAYTLFTETYHKGKLGILTTDDTTDALFNFHNKRIGIQTSHGSIAAIRKLYPKINLIEINATADLVTLLATGKLDAIIGNPLLFNYFARENQITNIKLSSYIEIAAADKSATFMHVGVRKDLPLLHQILQKAIATVSDEEKQLLENRWISSTPQKIAHGTVLLNEAEQSFLANHPVIRVQNEDDYPPYDFSEYGTPLGFSIDYLKLIAKKTGLSLTFVNGYTWQEILENIQNKELDIIHTSLQTKEREVYASFTRSYINATYALIVRPETDIVSTKDLSGKRLALLKGTKHFDYFSKLDPTIELVEYDTTKELLRSVLFNECDAAYESTQLAGFTLRESGFNGLEFRPVPLFEPNSGNWRIGVRKDWPELLSIINKGMDAISREEMSRLKSKWFGLWNKKQPTIELTPKERDFIAKHPILRVSNELDYPPYDFTIGKQPQGYSIDLLNILAERIGITISYVNGYTWHQLLNMFNKGDLDLLHTLNQTPERKKRGIFSKPYHFYKNYWIISKNGSEIDDIEQLYGKTVAVGKGWSQEEFLKNSYPKIRLLLVDGLDSMLDSVATGKADATLGEIQVMKYIFKKRGITDLKLSGWAKEYDKGEMRSFHFMAHNSAPELITILNKALETLTPGDITELERKWFGKTGREASGQDRNIVLSSKERKYLATKAKLKVSVYGDWMPYQKVDKNGKLEGMGANYLALFKKRLGTTFQVLPAKTQKEAFTAIQEGKSDILLMTEVSSALEEQMDITTPYISFPYVIATTSDKLFIDDITKKLDKRFAIVHRTTLIDKLQKRYPTIKLLEVDSIRTGLEKVRSGEVFGFIGTSAAIGYTIQKELLLDVKIAGTIAYNLELGVATRGSEPLLGSIFQKAVNNLTKEDTQRIYNQWVAVNYEQGIDYSLVWKILFISCLVLAVIMFWNRKLVVARRQTQKVKDQLQRQNKELERLSVTDRLTGLYNRMKLDQTLNKEIMRFKRYNTPLSLVILDIDYFKKINDTFGHQAGDTVLQSVAVSLKENIRGVDIVGRWGGEEFLVICPETNLTGAKFIAEKLRIAIERQDMDRDTHVTASFGVTEMRNDDEEEDLVRKADNALYRAKKEGRNRVESI